MKKPALPAGTRSIMADSIRTHAQWLHELRNVVSTASVATAMGRQLAHDDAQATADVLVEAEQALAACRELLAVAAEHVRDDRPADAIVMPRVVPRESAARPRGPGRGGRRRSDGPSASLPAALRDAVRGPQPRSRASSACLSGSPQR